MAADSVNKQTLNNPHAHQKTQPFSGKMLLLAIISA